VFKAFAQKFLRRPLAISIIDAPTDGNRDHEEAKASYQDPKPMNQELKEVTLLFGSPWTMVDHHGQTVVQAALPRVFDLKLGQLGWLIT